MGEEMLTSQKDALASQLAEIAAPSVVTRHIAEPEVAEEAPTE